VATPGIEAHFRTLELSTSATWAEVKKAYKKLCLKLHPDKNKGSQDAERRFKEVGVAYDEVCAHFKRCGLKMG